MAYFNECSQLIEGADKAQNEYWDILGDEKDPLHCAVPLRSCLPSSESDMTKWR